ncbi:MAG: response regulator [Ginsengibacter sp.]
MTKEQNNLKVLIVEDNRGDFVLIEDYLKEQTINPKIVHVWNFAGAVDLLSHNKDFDIILLDLSLPDKDGQNLITGVLKITDDIPVIALTGFEDIQFSTRSISLGVCDYLLKNELTAINLHKSILYCMERKKRIHQLQESEKRYSELFRLNPQPVWMFDLETFKFVQVNKAALDLYEYTEEEFLNLTVFDIRPVEDISLLKNSFKDRPEREEKFIGKFRHFTKSKKILEVEIQSNYIHFNDRRYRLVIVTDLTEKNRIEHKITRAIIATQENERYEIGAELHDNICQILASTHISLGVLARSIEPAGMDLYHQCREYITLATQEIRNLSHKLAPAFFNNSTLEEAFDMLLNNFNLEKKFDISLYFDEAVENSKINRELQLNLYRILQEELRNINKYARCKNIEVDLIVKNERIKMRITDDGIGFDVDSVKGGIGLSNMRRRVELFYGKFSIFSSPGNGCEIVVDIPLKSENLIPDKEVSVSLI